MKVLNVFQTLCLSLLFLCFALSDAQAQDEFGEKTANEIISEQSERLKVNGDTIRALEKRVRQLRNETIILTGDMEKQGFKFVSLKEEANKQKTFVTLLIVAVLFTLAFIFTLVRSTRSKQKYLNLLEQEKVQVSIQKELVSAQKEQTERALLDLQDSIRYAMRIQNAVLADPARISEMLGSEFFIFFKPKDIVSGDFYFVEKKNDWFIAAVADCTGHGVPGALLSMLAITMLNDIILKSEKIQASEILNELRTKMVMAMQQNELLNDQNDGLDITLLLLNKKEMTGQWAGANTPLIQIHGEAKVLKELRADKRPIGDYPDMGHFTNHQFNLMEGDKYYLFSDGYSDQFGGSEGKKYMKKRFKNDLMDISDMKMSDQKKKLADNLRDWMGTNGSELEQVDDITVFGIKI